ncbi:hypothetical protein ACFYNO_09245 [Kitasatospora sp. NPDC006697]
MSGAREGSGGFPPLVRGPAEDVADFTHRPADDIALLRAAAG